MKNICKCKSRIRASLVFDAVGFFFCIRSIPALACTNPKRIKNREAALVRIFLNREDVPVLTAAGLLTGLILHDVVAGVLVQVHISGEHDDWRSRLRSATARSRRSLLQTCSAAFVIRFLSLIFGPFWGGSGCAGFRI